MFGAHSPTIQASTLPIQVKTVFDQDTSGTGEACKTCPVKKPKTGERGGREWHEGETRGLFAEEINEWYGGRVERVAREKREKSGTEEERTQWHGVMKFSTQNYLY